MSNPFRPRLPIRALALLCRYVTPAPLLIGLLITSCSNPNYSRREGLTDEVTDQSVRYGSIAALGGAGFLAGKELGGNNTAGILGATIGAGGAYGLNKFFDHKRQDAYHTGYDDGLASARAEILNEEWTREAIYGLNDNGRRPPSLLYREVYVPSRVINGVKFQGEYQTVPLVK